MTGFARADGHDDTVTWYWEIRSLNGKGLDIRLRLPSGYEALEQTVRESCSKKLSRGNCSIFLNVKKENSSGELQLNEAALQQVTNASKKLETITGKSLTSVDSLLNIRGVLELVEPIEDEETILERRNKVLNDFTEALNTLQKFRVDEGKRLETAIESYINKIESLVVDAENVKARTPKFIKEKLQEQIKRLLETDIQFNEDRLYQEATILAAKADIMEEIERLKSHIQAARDLITSSKPVGRKLDFLTQEFNREANTICSKSNDVETSRIGLELKATIDQMREQVQNIE